MKNTDLTPIQERFIFNPDLNSGYKFISAILGLKNFKTIDELYKAGYIIEWNEGPFRIFNVKKNKIEAPKSIRSIWDNEGETLDRYSIVFKDFYDREEKYFECLGLSIDPTYALGFSQFSGAMDGPHLGKKLSWEELPENIQKHIISRLQEDS